MAFDQSTRNRLQKFVTTARTLLSEEFTRQLQNLYGLDPVTGRKAEMNTLSGLSNTQQQTAQLLRQVASHYEASGQKSAEALDRIVREQAFTVLNRLAALRMAESRGFLIESIGQGYQSKGFQLYQRIAGSALGDIGQTYQSYLFSLFDEFSTDLAVLFDRFSMQGRLFPKESVLQELVDEINHPEIANLWCEDETIGWIYQYFNSKEERKKMRDESQAPRNSRELAVRNQFFTPRYVVEFLTDNTLGRIWFEMTQGKTDLKLSCNYLVTRPNEVFLAENEDAPEEETHDENLSQEELLNLPAYIPYRSIKDPRELRMLDPACGSMHFGLYAFDLFEQIYLEAWGIEERLGYDTFERSQDLPALHDSFENIDVYKKAIPRLIIEHNIHGVDIDPRAAQIAGLSLWMRAQKSWYTQGVKASDRPLIQRSNIVCAEPMPGEKELLNDFTSQLKPTVLGQMVEIIFEKMELAGEAGSLLKIEEEIEDAIDKARKEFKQEMKDRKNQGLFPEFEQPKQGAFDFSDLTEKTRFWSQAEEKIINALSTYAKQASDDIAGQKRLFAQDAAKGFAFIDLCRKQYDVILMNPPFGEFSEKYREQASKKFTSGSHDIIAAFVERFLAKLERNSFIAAISSRAIFYGPSNYKWREEVFIPSNTKLWVELGQGVLDDAMVETCMYITGGYKTKNSIFIRQNDHTKLLKSSLFHETELFFVDTTKFLHLHKSPFAYWINHQFFFCFENYNSLEESNVKVRVGLQTGDDFRFIRFWNEIDSKLIDNHWFTHAKGGDNSPFYSDNHLVVQWSQEGKEVSSTSSVRLNMYSGSNNDLYLKPGLTFAYRTNRFSPGIMQANTIAGVAGMGVIPKEEGLIFYYLGLLNSAMVNAFIDARLGQLESQSLYQAGTIAPTPIPEIVELYKVTIEENARKAFEILYKQASALETSRHFCLPKINESSLTTITTPSFSSVLMELGTIIDVINQKSLELYGFDKEKMSKYIQKDKKKTLKSIESNLANFFATADDYMSIFLGMSMGRWNILHATGQSISSQHLDPLGSLPTCSPGMLQNVKGFPIEETEVPEEYPLRISWSGIVVNDEGDNEDIVARIREVIEAIWRENAADIESEACSILGVQNLRDYFAKPAKFFSEHLKRYSKSRRQAPIYWPLSTESGNYTLWIYYHRLNDQTLYTAVNDFVGPKIDSIEKSLHILQTKSSRNRDEEKELSNLTDSYNDLTVFKDELLRIAAFYRPNLNDGVQITAAPLWKFFKLTKWRNTLKKTWTELEAGKYDWAHLAFSIWPDRVREKCKSDKSLAIAHDLEDVYEG